MINKIYCNLLLNLQQNLCIFDNVNVVGIYVQLVVYNHILSNKVVIKKLNTIILIPIN